MSDESKTRKELLNELGELRQKISQLETLEQQHQLAAQSLVESEERYRKITDTVTDYMFRVRVEHGQPVETVHGTACVAVTGYTSEEFAANPYLWFQMVHEEDTHLVQQQASQIYSGKKGEPIEHRIIRKDGTIRWVSNTPVLHVNEKGELISYDGLIKDITERRIAEEELKGTRDYLDNIIENLGEGIFVSNTTGCVTRVNKAFLELMGWTKDEMIGMHHVEFIPQEPGIYESTLGDKVELTVEILDSARRGFIKLFEEGKLVNFETYFLNKQKNLLLIQENMVLLWDGKGERIGGVGIIRDITAKKKAEEALKKSEEKYQNLLENASDAILVANEDGIIVGVNKSAERMFGYTREQLIEKSVSILLPSQVWEKEKMYMEEFSKTHKLVVGVTSERAMVRKDGQLITVEPSFSVSKLDGEFLMTVVLRDISERKRVEREIKEARDFLESVIESSRDGILITDSAGYITSANKAMEMMSKYRKEELIGKHTSVLMAEDEAMRKIILQKMTEMFEKGFIFYEVVQMTRDGNLINVECATSLIKDEEGNNIGAVSIIRDITERKKMENQLLQSEKLKSLGELAGGVAHDFNNILAAILGRAQLLKMVVGSTQGDEGGKRSVNELKKGLDIIEKAAKDGAETVRRIQEFSRKRDDEAYFATVDINEAIDHAIEYTKVRWKDDAELKGIKINVQKELSPIAPVSGRAAELREVFTNLINNAIDAMPHGGTIRLETVNEGTHVSIKVKDTGIGIPGAIRERIFDPFFTTKGVKSTGLGLSVSYGIIKRHKGIILVDSAEGKGTLFTITIPFAEGVVKSEAKVKPLKDTQKRAHILVVEDEVAVRNLLASILTMGGHKVETAPDGTQGIRLFQEKKFDLVFTDLGMPGMSGWQVAREVKRIHGGIPVAIITGWNIELEEAEMRENGVDLIVQKPFEVDRVLRLVQEGIIIRDKFKKQSAKK